MSEQMTAYLAGLDHKQYSREMQIRFKDDKAWLDMLDPRIVERTRSALVWMIDSIKAQQEAARKRGENDKDWVKRGNLLASYAAQHLSKMPPEPPSSTKEAQAWRAFSAKLAQALRDNDTKAIKTIRAPYSGLTASEWLIAREEKTEKK